MNNSFLIAVIILFICIDFIVTKLFTQTFICPNITTALTKAGEN